MRKYDSTQETKQGVEKRIQCVIFTLLLALLTIAGTATLVMASDVSDAEYRGKIEVSNNGTLASNVFTVFDINTQSLIDTGKLNATANDTAIQTAAGVDVAFMPSVNATYPWATHVPSIGEDQTLYQYLFTSGVTGGKIRYFPGDGGMTTTDNETLELSDNFTIEQKGWIDTDSGADKNLFVKDSAIQGFVSPTVSGNITVKMPGGEDWISPTGFTDPDTKWGTETLAYDENTGTYAMQNINVGPAWSTYLQLEHTAIDCDAIRYFCGGNAADVDAISVDVFYGGSWNNIYEGAFVQDVWETKNIGSIETVTECRIKLYQSSEGGRDAYIYEVDFQEALYLTVTATGISSGEYTVKTTADTANLSIYIDNVLKDSVALSGAEVPDNSEDWVFLQNDVMPYMEYQDISVNGTQVQYIDWEYGTTFSDTSGYGNDAVPTFRTASSDPDVSAELVSFLGIKTATPPSAVGETGWDILPTVPDAPEGFFTELNMSFWGAGYIQEFCDATDIPLPLVVFPYAFGLAIGSGGLAWYISSGGGKQHGRGSLLAMAITTLVVMIYFVYGGGGVIPAWVLLPFGIEVLVLIVWRQTPSPF